MLEIAEVCSIRVQACKCKPKLLTNCLHITIYKLHTPYKLLTTYELPPALNILPQHFRIVVWRWGKSNLFIQIRWLCWMQIGFEPPSTIICAVSKAPIRQLIYGSGPHLKWMKGAIPSECRVMCVYEMHMNTGWMSVDRSHATTFLTHSSQIHECGVRTIYMHTCIRNEFA